MSFFDYKLKNIALKNILSNLIKWIIKHHFIPITLAPSLIILTAYVYYPSLYSFYLSLYKTKLFKAIKFIGFDNYTDIFNDSLFWKALLNTTIYTVGSITGTIIVGFLLAVILNSQLRGKDLFRTAFFIPYIIPFAAHALLWYWLFDPRYGLVNYLIGYLGIDPIPWLTSRDWVLPAFILMDIWKRAGFAMVLFLAGLQTIPDELYDSSTIDGASNWQKLIKITIPLLSPVTLFVIIMCFLHTFQLFVEPFVMTKGGPGNASTSVVYLIYQEGFRSLNIGRSSAIAVILFIIIFLLTIFLVRRFDIKEIY